MGARRVRICYSRTQGPASHYVSRREQSDITEAQSFHASDLLREGSETKEAEGISPRAYGLLPTPRQWGAHGQPRSPEERVAESGGWNKDDRRRQR